MFKRFKSAVATAVAIVITIAMASCSNEEDVKNPAATTSTASAMESTLQDSYSAILNADLSLESAFSGKRGGDFTFCCIYYKNFVNLQK